MGRGRECASERLCVGVASERCALEGREGGHGGGREGEGTEERQGAAEARALAKTETMSATVIMPFCDLSSLQYQSTAIAARRPSCANVWRFEILSERLPCSTVEMPLGRKLKTTASMRSVRSWKKTTVAITVVRAWFQSKW